jgi:TPR repeat protein
MRVLPALLFPAFGALVISACASAPPPPPEVVAPPAPQAFTCPAGAVWDGATCKAQHACEVEQTEAATAAQKSAACIGEADCEKQCEAGTMRSCTDLALKLDKKGSVTERSLELYKKACFGGDGDGCHKLGAAYRFAYGGLEKDQARAMELFHQACNCRSAAGCNDLAFGVERGEGVAKDEKLATSLYLKSCELGHPLGCKNSGVMYENGMGIEKDLGRAREFYLRACEAKQELGCYQAALTFEHATPPAYTEALEHHKKACGMGVAAACTHYGYLVEKGRGAQADNVVAVEYYRKGCDGGSDYGCSNTGVMWEYGQGTGRKDTARATEYYEKACKLGLADGCQKMKNVVSRLTRECDAQSAVKPKPGLPKAADAPPSEGCTNVGYLYEHGIGVSKDERAAADFYKRSCDSKLPVGCLNLGNVYDGGRVFPKDQKKAAEFYKKACEFGGAGGCNNLGFAYERGEGLPKDERRALDLYKKACEKGSDTACTNVRYLTERLALAKTQRPAEVAGAAGNRTVGSHGSASIGSDALRPVTAPH